MTGDIEKNRMEIETWLTNKNPFLMELKLKKR